MAFQKHLARKGRPKVPIALRDIGDRHLSYVRPQQTIGRPSTSPMAKAGGAVAFKHSRQTVSLPSRYAHQSRRSCHSHSARNNRRQHLGAAKFSFAHLHPAHARLPRTAVHGSVTFLICHGGTF